MQKKRVNLWKVARDILVLWGCAGLLLACMMRVEPKVLAKEVMQTGKTKTESSVSYINEIPYKGMKEAYIHTTSMGRADCTEKNGTGKYTWYADNGCLMLTVYCVDGMVSTVIRYGEQYYWTENGMPKPSAITPKPQTMQSVSSR